MIFGLASSLSFAFGTLSLKSKGITQISRTYYSYNKYVAQSLSSQKAQYIIGALFLFLSFLFQGVKIFFSKELFGTTIQHAGGLLSLSILTSILIVCLYTILYHSIKLKTIATVTSMVEKQDHQAKLERQKKL